MKRLFPACLLFAAGPAWGLSIQLDYTYDQANGNFFGTHPAAKAALEAAAGDLSLAVLPSLAAVGTDVFTGMEGGDTATFDWRLSIRDPSTGAQANLETFTFATDVVRLFVGVGSLGGTTLGLGGPSGAGFSLAGSGTSEAAWPATVAEAEAASNAVMVRGGGPVIGSLSGSSTFGTVTANYTVRFGTLAGSISFDNDRNNNGIQDSEADLAATWHFDHTAPVAPGKNDFYSVALHEMLHVLGVGSGVTWDSQLFDDGNGDGFLSWDGPAVAAVAAMGGLNIIDGDGSHLRENVMSRRLSDGMMQEVVMTPTLLTGTRNRLTELDVAFLRDLGYQTIPEPGSAGLLALGMGLIVGVRRRRQSGSDPHP